MMSDLNAAEAGTLDLPFALRGYRPRDVVALVSALNRQLDELTAERDRLVGRLGEFATRDLEGEFRKLGSEVTEVLEAARRASESMRERASTDAARWRSEALAEAELMRREAKADAEHLRGDAWNTAESLLAECQREIEHLRSDAEKDALRKVGEAERESHKAISKARREADDLIRSARMEAERLVVSAQSEHDEIIDSAHRQAEASQERTRALEQRRDELKGEIDSVRAALAGMEGEMDERREKLGLSQPTAGSATEKNSPRWSPGETVRVLRKAGDPVDQPEQAKRTEASTPQPRVTQPQRAESDGDSEIKIVHPAKPRTPDPRKSPAEFADALVSALAVDKPGTPPPVGEVEAEAPIELEPATSPGPSATAVETAAPSETASPVLQEVSGLFARLRSPQPVTAGPAPATDEKPEPEPTPADATPPSAVFDPIELRDRLLLPAANRALRGIKRQLTEEQNLALEQLRIDEKTWVPDAVSISKSVRADLAALELEAFAAGHEAAEEVAGVRIAQPAAKGQSRSDFVEELVSEVSRSLHDGRNAGHGARQLGSDVSRIFRAWRTDEAERRIRDISSRAYHFGLVTSLKSAGFERFAWVVTGKGCASCRAAADGRETNPPLHPGCSCTVVPA